MANPYSGLTFNRRPFDIALDKSKRAVYNAFGYIPRTLNRAAMGAGAVAGVTNPGRVTAAEMAPVLSQKADRIAAMEGAYNQQSAMMESAFNQKRDMAAAEWEDRNRTTLLGVLSSIASTGASAFPLVRAFKKTFGLGENAVGGGSNQGGGINFGDLGRFFSSTLGSQNTGDNLDLGIDYSTPQGTGTGLLAPLGKLNQYYSTSHTVQNPSLIRLEGLFQRKSGTGGPFKFLNQNNYTF